MEQFQNAEPMVSHLVYDTAVIAVMLLGFIVGGIAILVSRERDKRRRREVAKLFAGGGK